MDLEDSDDDGYEGRSVNDETTFKPMAFSPHSKRKEGLVHSGLSINNFDSVFHDEDDDIPFSAPRANAHLNPKSRSGKARHPLYKWKFPEHFTGANFEFRPIDKDQGPSDRSNWKPHKYFLTYFSDHFQHMDFVKSYHYQKTYDNQLAGDEIEIEHIFQCNNSDGQSEKPEDQNDLRQKIQSPSQHESRQVL
ncbi:hypothetical protein QYM36_007151 [Artemia franciscana]|uniref:Uncharacterized protein n=1 Tax=Artemia franciscana TaxID=6661 RepID=A0AA88L913_ARTSF|nr:hypothetical protein QYM36_007151 [Artemia franciscana]